jgi:hypothetical protein
MKSKYHREMAQNALGDVFSETALKTILRANIWQDRPSNQFGHDYIHFDGSAFEAGLSYIERQKDIIITCLKTDQIEKARKAFGQITHTWQDFYSHSNYVQLWLEAHPDAKPEDIEPSDPAILNSDALMSGKNYGLMEFVSMLPLISKCLVPRMPADSHARMNKDAPSTGPLFPYGIAAGEKRTAQLWQEVRAKCAENQISQSQIDRFLGRESDN